MQQPTFEITFHPVDLSRHGLNPYKESIYRVVWADTRTCKVMHNGKIHTLPRYMHGDEGSAAGHWILEMWQPGEVVLGMSREQYRDFLAQFPNAAAEEFPEKGEFELSLVFPGEVDEALLQKHLDAKIANRLRMTDGDRLRNLEAIEDAKEKAVSETFDEMYDEARETSIQ